MTARKQDKHTEQRRVIREFVQALLQDVAYLVFVNRCATCGDALTEAKEFARESETLGLVDKFLEAIE